MSILIAKLEVLKDEEEAKKFSAERKSKSAPPIVRKNKNIQYLARQNHRP